MATNTCNVYNDIQSDVNKLKSAAEAFKKSHLSLQRREKSWDEVQKNKQTTGSDWQCTTLSSKRAYPIPGSAWGRHGTMPQSRRATGRHHCATAGWYPDHEPTNPAQEGKVITTNADAGFQARQGTCFHYWQLYGKGIWWHGHMQRHCSLLLH